MSCKDYENEILAYLDRRLDGAGEGRVKRHLGECAACRAEADAMAKTWKLLGYLPGRTLKAGLPARAAEMARLQLALEKSWGRRLLRHAPWIASAAVLLIVFTVTVLRPPPAPNPEAEYETILASLDSEDQEVVQNLDLYENLQTVENIDVLEDEQIVEYFDLVSSLSDEDF